MRYKNILFGLLYMMMTTISFAITKRVLFIGNSYTYVNDLPLTLKNLAASSGDTLIYDSNTPGGYTLQQHASNNTTLSKIMQGNWDYVVLQEQSQRPAFPISQVETDVFPYAKKLDSLIHIYNPCAETVFYMTWGYKNGDASNCAFYPPICTYSGMDSLLRERYMMMADSNNAMLSPVGAVRKYIRTHYPSIELYQPDESHPSEAGTYAAACSFYSVLFRKNPANLTFNGNLSLTDASNIRSSAKTVAYDSLSSWYVGEYDPNAAFTYTQSGNNYTFTNGSSNAIQYYWDFGDGATSTIANPMHTYTNTCSFNVRLIATKCSYADTTMKTINITTAISDLQSDNIILYPNPVKDILTIEMPIYLLQSILITNAAGKTLPTIYTNEKQAIKFDFTNYATGIYFIKMRIQGEEIIKKVIKY